MSADRIKRIDHDVTEIHAQVKKSSLILRQRMKALRDEMNEQDFLGGLNDESEGITE